jgi:uncharacterized protein
MLFRPQNSSARVAAPYPDQDKPALGRLISRSHAAFQISALLLALLLVALASRSSAAQSSNAPNAFAGLSAKPAFDCAKATSTAARIICIGPAGATADWDLNSAYWARYFTLQEGQRDQFAQALSQWFDSLGPACGIDDQQTDFFPDQQRCVLDAYKKRTVSYKSQLSGDALAESLLSPEQHAAIQQALIILGLLDDRADGLFGPHTRVAISRFQAQSKAPESGFLATQQRQTLLSPVSTVKPSEQVQHTTNPSSKDETIVETAAKPTEKAVTTVPPMGVTQSEIDRIYERGARDYKVAVLPRSDAIINGAQCSFLINSIDIGSGRTGAQTRITIRYAIICGSNSPSANAFSFDFTELGGAEIKADQPDGNNCFIYCKPGRQCMSYAGGKTGNFQESKFRNSKYCEIVSRTLAEVRTATIGQPSPSMSSTDDAPDTDCDTIFDSMRRSGGGSAHFNMNKLAIPACEAAVRQYPDSARLVYQLAHAYHTDAKYDAAMVQYGKAVELNRRAADQGNASAQYNLGVAYENGEGVPADHAQAVAWFREAAEQGDARAQVVLGSKYYYGQDVAQDYTEAVVWYRKAAEQDNADAQYNLGVTYQNGHGVARDFSQAIDWYRRAAGHGQIEAQRNLERLKPEVEDDTRREDGRKQGYQEITFEDFKLDGEKLAATNAKLMMRGIPKKFGDIDTLQPGLPGVFAARLLSTGIPLLAEDGTRDVRKIILECSGSFFDCFVTVIGHADICSQTNVYGTSKSVPCLAVEDGWRHEVIIDAPRPSCQFASTCR